LPQAESVCLSAGVQKEISAGVQKETVLQGVISEDIWPDVERWRWGLSDGPELSKRVVDDGDGGLPGGGDVPTATQKVDLLVGVDPAFQMERQMQVQQGWRRTGTRGGALFRQGFFPSGVGTEARGAADGGVLSVTLPVEHALGGGIIADLFVGQDGHQTFLQGAKAAFDLAFGLRTGGRPDG
jgi:hypothetical protein